MPISDDFTSRRNVADTLTGLSEIRSALAEHTTWLKLFREPTIPIPPSLQQEDGNILFKDHGPTQYKDLSSIYQSYPLSFCTHSLVDDSLCQFPQLEARSSSQEQLITEAKGVYEGLTMLESEWTHMVDAQRLRRSGRRRSSKIIPDTPRLRRSRRTPNIIPNTLRWPGRWGPSKSPVKLNDNQDFLLTGPFRPTRPGPISTKLINLYIGANLLGAHLSFELEHIKNSVELVSLTIVYLDDAYTLEDTVLDELLEWLEKIELISDHLVKRLQRIYSQFLIYALIFFWLFNEFPDGIRHLCTTMPWTIWPALVVLWGVCWMFYSDQVSYEAVEAELPLSLDQQGRLLNFQGDFCSSMTLFQRLIMREKAM